MAMIPRGFVVACIVLIPVFLGGCVSVTEPSALDHLDVAEEEAFTWDAQASLVLAAGIEGPVDVIREALDDGPDWLGLEAWNRSGGDVEVGDGRAPVLLYRFAGEEEGDVLDVVVGEEGELVLAEERTPEGARVLVEAVNVDSPAALEGAVQSNRALQDALEVEGAAVLFVLEQDPDRGRSLWTVLAAAPGEGGVSVVDAGSGQVLSSHAGTGSYPRS